MLCDFVKKIDGWIWLGSRQVKTRQDKHSKMSSKSNIAYRLAVNDDDATAEARCKTGVKDGDFRVKKGDKNFNVESIHQQIQDYYQRLVNEVKRGERNPVRLGKWKSVERHYDEFLLSRIAPNFAQFKKSSSDNTGMKVALIPASFTAPHPTEAEKEAYMARWDDDGDLHKAVMAECRKHTDGTICLLPEVVHSLHSKSLLMICVVIMVIPKELVDDMSK
jgi:hypothetical protein